MTPQQISRIKLRTGLLFLPVLFVLVAFLISWRLKAPEYKSFVQWASVIVAALVPVIVWFLERGDLKVAFDFGVSLKQGRGLLYVSNYGAKIFTITRICVRTNDDRCTKEASITISGGDHEIDISEELVKAIRGHWDDVEVSFEYNFVNGSARSERKPYHVMASDGSVINIRAGFHEMRMVECPTCHTLTLFSVTDLANEDKASIRKVKVMNDLKKSCPNHRSAWLTSSTDEPKFFPAS